MTFLKFVFIFSSLVMLTSAILVVTVRKMLHAALWLVLSLFMVGVMFVLLENPFLGIVQLLVYIGAIAILMIFAVMLTRKMMYDDTTQFYPREMDWRRDCYPPVHYSCWCIN